MDVISDTIADAPVTTGLAATMEDTLQAFAVRAACFVGEFDVPYSREFDGQDFGAAHILVRVGNEPAGTLRLRWFRTFAMPERLCVVRRFRGQALGRRLLEHSYHLAETRGCTALYTRALPGAATYLEKQGWQRLQPPAARPVDGAVIALARPVNPAVPWTGLDAVDAKTLFDEFRLEVSAAMLRESFPAAFSSSSAR